MRNTNANTLKADAFATADCKFQLGNLAGTPAGFAPSGNSVADDPNSECDENGPADPACPTARFSTGQQHRRPAGHQRPGRLQRNRRRRPGPAAATTTTPSGVARATTSSRAAPATTSRSAARVTTSSPTPAATTCPRAVRATTPSTPAPAWTSSWAATGKDFTNGGANANETFAGEGDDFVYRRPGPGRRASATAATTGRRAATSPTCCIGRQRQPVLPGRLQQARPRHPDRPGRRRRLRHGGRQRHRRGRPGHREGRRRLRLRLVEIGQGDQAQDSDLDLPIAPLDILPGRRPGQVQRGRGAVRLEPQRHPARRRRRSRPRSAAAGSSAATRWIRRAST